MATQTFSPRPAAAFFFFKEKLDEKVILQAFALYQPNDNATYIALTNNGSQLAQWGITEIWSSLPYLDFNYGEGYDLGAYGKSPIEHDIIAEMKAATNARHNQNIHIQVDVVQNQICGLSSGRCSS